MAGTISELLTFKRRLFRRIDGERILKRRYRDIHGKSLDLNGTKTFSVRLFSRMIEINRSGNPVFTRLADKYLARDYIREKIGERYLADLLWDGTDPLKIPFDRLPYKCVVKTNHGSGGVIILDPSSDRQFVVRTLRELLCQNYYWIMREYHYFDIKPRILIEKYLDDGHSDGPLDYRFWCFNGNPEIIQIDNNEHSLNAFYDQRWYRLNLRYRDRGSEREVEKPINLNDMVSIAARLSAPFDFVRVDLYNINGRIYFGELTFTPTAGSFTFKPSCWDDYLGSKWGGEVDARYHNLCEKVGQSDMQIGEHKSE